MSTETPSTPISALPRDLASFLAAVRPRLHRYCARMAGSVLDGEDIVQDTLVKATLHYDPIALRNAESWLFRIAHNTAMDFLRRRAREKHLFVDEPTEVALAEEPAAVDRREMATLALQSFVRLTIAQRSAVILADVLGYEMAEAAEIMGISLTALKAVLHRGRLRLRELAGRGDDRLPPVLTADDQARVSAYAQRFNAHDFDGLRAMLAEEARLDLVARHRVQGRAAVSNYFGNYSRIEGIRVEPACIEGRPGLLVFEEGGMGADPAPAYFVVLQWRDGKLQDIRDFRYARYAIEGLHGTVVLR